jgi:hypothetical protein
MKKDIISRVIEQTQTKLKEYWKLKDYIKNDDYTRLINFLTKKYFAYLLEVFNAIDAGDLFLSNIEYELIKFTSGLTEDDIQIILKINEEIKRQIQTYAYHEELVENTKSIIIVWSNGCVCWNTYSTKEIKKGNTVKLDASMVLVPFPRNIVDKYLCLIDQNPLYKFSFEAVYQRGEGSFLEGVLGWMAKVTETEEYQKMQEKYS